MNSLFSSGLKVLWNQISQLWRNAAFFSEPARDREKHVRPSPFRAPWRAWRELWWCHGGSVSGNSANMILAEFEVAFEGGIMRSSPEYFVKTSFSSCCWQESYGLRTNLAMKAQDEQLPFRVFVFSCIWFCCSEKHGDASKAQPPRLGWRGRSAWCRWMWAATCWGGEAVWSCPRLCTRRKGPQDRSSAGHLLPTGRAPVCRHCPQATGEELSQMKFGQFRW